MKLRELLQEVLGEDYYEVMLDEKKKYPKNDPKKEKKKEYNAEEEAAKEEKNNEMRSDFYDNAFNELIPGFYVSNGLEANAVLDDEVLKKLKELLLKNGRVNSVPDYEPIVIELMNNVEEGGSGMVRHLKARIAIMKRR